MKKMLSVLLTVAALLAFNNSFSMLGKATPAEEKLIEKWQRQIKDKREALKMAISKSQNARAERLEKAIQDIQYKIDMKRGLVIVE